MSVTLVFQSTGIVPGSAGPITMDGPSLTLGRGDENDLVLPDPDRLISKRHCVIEDRGETYVIVDLSTNGTFLNYSKTALGSSATPLNNGDIISLGGYEIAIEISASVPVAHSAGDFDIPPPLGEAPAANDKPRVTGSLDVSGGEDFLDDFLSAPTSSNASNDLIPDDPFEGGSPMPGSGNMIPDDFDLELGPSSQAQENHSASTQDHFAAPATQKSSIPDDWDLDIGAEPKRDVTPSQSAPMAPPKTPSDQLPVSSNAARVFLKAAGVEHLNIPDSDLETSMAQLGEVMQTLITGIREVLMTRAAIKSEFRMGQTTIGSTNNNPLKFSISAEQALEAMAKPTTKGYLDPTSAARQALDDIKAHEVAVISGMEAALKGVLKQLDPEKLAGQIETSGAIGSLLKGKKARYWEVYEKMYSDVSDQAEEDFQELFSREFSRAYQEQLKKLG